MGESMADEQNKRWLVTLNLNNTSFVLEEELIVDILPRLKSGDSYR